MSNETVTLEQIHKDILFLSQEIQHIKNGIEDIRDMESLVKPEYLEKLKNIEKGKFLSRAELEKELGD